MGYHLSKLKGNKTYTSMCYLTDVKETRKQTIKGTKHEKKKKHPCRLQPSALCIIS